MADKAKKLADKSCCPSECPAKGDQYACDSCGFSVVVVVPCTCCDCECVALACCGQPLCKKN